MTELSRRALLACSAVAILSASGAGNMSVACTLEESQAAFRQLRLFVGNAGVGRVLVESSCGFAAEDLTWLKRFGISVGEPVAVSGPSWVRFSWPIPTLIRDFGRACPLAGGEVIARLGELPVAILCRHLVVLGSALGPHIYAGDRDAQFLLDAIRSSVWAQ